MKCDFCDQKATVFLTQLVEGQMKKVCLCDPCAKERGVTDPTGFSLADVLLGGAALGTAAEVIPVVALDRRVIGTGKPGPFTQRFLAAFHELAMSTGTPVR